MEATGLRSAVDVLLGIKGGGGQIGPSSVQEGEVGHYRSGLADICGKMIQLLIQPAVDAFT